MEPALGDTGNGLQDLGLMTLKNLQNPAGSPVISVAGISLEGNNGFV